MSQPLKARLTIKNVRINLEEIENTVRPLTKAASNAKKKKKKRFKLILLKTRAIGFLL